MPKIKLTKGELKRQRDALRRYERYLPTLQLKKQQLQLEIAHQNALAQEKERLAARRRETVLAWAGLLEDRGFDIKGYLKPQEVVTSARNIAGVDIPVFNRVVFRALDYDLFVSPMWVDVFIEQARLWVSLEEELSVIRRGLDILRQELRIATQRVNLFEKVKIPETQETIRLIKIAIGDQMTNAVGRSKIAKRKIEFVLMREEALV